MLVVPTCRSKSIAAFFEAWGDRGGWDEVCVIEDALDTSSEVNKVLPPGSYHYSHSEIGVALGEDSWIISRQDSSCRNFGLLIARELGMDVLTLDDDCFPSDGCRNFVDEHRHMMRHYKWVDAIPEQSMRGKPYRNLGLVESVINIGLWSKNPDLDAPRSLVSGMPTDFCPPDGNCLIPARQYIPVCGMNLFIRHEAIPLFYFAPMGHGQPYRRFDDIWGGVVAKRALDEVGWHLSVGEPHVEHQRASDPFANLIKEAPGIVANEQFWELIDSIKLPAPPPHDEDRPQWVVVGIAAELEKSPDKYLQKYGEALRTWVRLCRRSKS
jgi:hypothetical protein